MAIQILQTVEVGSAGASSIEFTNIPQTGVDLQILMSARTDMSTGENDQCDIEINNVANDLEIQTVGGNDSTGVATRLSGNPRALLVANNTITSGAFSSNTVHIKDYTSSTPKYMNADNGVADSVAASDVTVNFVFARTTTSTSPVTSIKINPVNGSFVEYTKASLYVIL